MIELTALQYLNMISNLPNPMRYYTEYYDGRPILLSVAYFEESLNQDTIFLALPNEDAKTLISAKTLEFEIVSGGNVWFWQPTKEVKIIKASNKFYKKNWR